MATKEICDFCGKEIRGNKNTLIGYKNAVIARIQIFDFDLCDECFKDIKRRIDNHDGK